MPQANLFRHQAYRATRPTSPHHRISAGAYPAVGSRAFRQRMREVGQALRAGRVAAVYLVHGSADGLGSLGVLAELARRVPAVDRALGGIRQHLAARPAADAAHFSQSYASLFEAAIKSPGEPRIPVELFCWSGENHHLGRADGAVRLIDELCRLGLRPGQRVLLWGHGHAGNVFALMTNLLARHPAALEQFFRAAAIYYRWPLVGLVDVPVWDRVASRLQNPGPPLAGAALDLVTFGTPIAYGWDSGGYRRLLHFIHHRPAAGLPIYRAAWPPQLDDLLTAAGGDYVQQLGIAGTSCSPGLCFWRARLADRRLGRLVRGDPAEAEPLERFRAGAIVPDEGTTLLVDYGPSEGPITQHYAGHAVYVRKRWLLFHAEEVAQRFYAAQASMVA